MSSPKGSRTLRVREIYAQRKFFEILGGFKSTTFTEFVNRNGIQPRNNAYPVFAVMSILKIEHDIKNHHSYHGQRKIC